MCMLMNFLDRRLGRRSLVLLLVCALTACSTLHPVPGSSSEVRNRIRGGALLGPGDSVRVSTVTGRPQEFVVSAVEADYLVGNDVRIPIDSITQLEIRDHSAAKSTARVVLVVGLEILVMCAFAMLFAAGSMSGMEFDAAGSH